MNTIQTITVIGATGMLGKPVTEVLVNEGFSLKALVRDLDKAKSRLPGSVELIQGNIRNIDDLKQAFRGSQGVYISLSTRPGEKKAAFRTEVEGIKNIIEAARRTGIQRMAYLSALVKNYRNFDWWVFENKREACELLKSCAIPTIIFSPSSFMENFPEIHRRENKVIILGNQKTRSWYISAEDYGRQVAQSFKLPENDHSEYPVQGPEPFNTEEAARVFIEAHPSDNLSMIKLPMWLVKFIGLFSEEMAFGAKITEAINHYDEKFMSEQTWEDLGKPGTTLEKFSRSL